MRRSRTGGARPCGMEPCRLKVRVGGLMGGGPDMCHVTMLSCCQAMRIGAVLIEIE